MATTAATSPGAWAQLHYSPLSREGCDTEKRSCPTSRYWSVRTLRFSAVTECRANWAHWLSTGGRPARNSWQACSEQAGCWESDDRL